MTEVVNAMPHYLLKSDPLPWTDADALAAGLSHAVDLESSSVSVVEVDEDCGLWRVEVCCGSDVSPNAVAGFSGECTRFAIEPLSDIDWVARSLEGLGPVVAGRFVVHGRHHRRSLRPGGVAVEIEAATAFGTGHHATTLGCLLAADHILKQARPGRVLDVGCGSGVLAIAVARASRRPALAVDIDPEAVRVASLNAQANGAGALVKTLTAQATGWRVYAGLGRFDLVFANILADPLVALAPRLVRLLAPGGFLVVSGITAGQARAVSAAYRCRGLRLVRRLMIGGWSTLVLDRPPIRGRPAAVGAAGAPKRAARRPVALSGYRRCPTPYGGSRCA